MTEMLVHGMTLKLERIRRQVKGIDLAAKMNVSPSRLSHIESRYAVPANTAADYRAALATFPSLATPVDGQDVA